MSKLPYDPRLFGICAGSGMAASFVASIVARIATSDWRTNQTFFFATVLCVLLAGLYTWIKEKQPDASKIIPIALLIIFCLFIPGELSDAHGNPESMARFWSALPSFLGIVATSAAMIWQTWAPKLRAWAKKPEPAPAPAAKKKAKPRPPPEPEPEPAPDPTPPDAAPPLQQDEEENTVEERPRPSRPEIVTGLPRRRK